MSGTAATNIPMSATPKLAASDAWWRRLVGDAAMTSGAAVVGHALGVMTSLLLRGLLSPSEMGVWQGLKLGLGYSNYANLGISKGAAREVSVAIGRGDLEAARRNIGLAVTANTLSSLACGAIPLLVGVYWWACSSFEGAATWGMGLCALATLVVAQRHVSFQTTVLRARQDFRSCAELAIIEAASTLVLCGGAIAWLGLPGMYVGSLASLLISAWFLARRGMDGWRFTWDPRQMRRLVAIGGPILAAGALSTLFRSLDRLTLLTFSNDRAQALGCYTTATLVASQLFGMANMLAMLVAPRLAERFGMRASRRPVAALAAQSGEALASGLALVAGGAMVVAPTLLAWLLADYRAGIDAANYLLPGAIFLGLSLTWSQYLVAVSRERLALVAIVAALAVAAPLQSAAVMAGGGLVGLAISTSLSYKLYFMLLVRLALAREFNRARWTRLIVGLLVAVTPPVALAAVLETAWPTRDATPFAVTALLAIGLKLALVTIAWCATVVIGFEYGGWRDVWRASRACGRA